MPEGLDNSRSGRRSACEELVPHILSPFAIHMGAGFEEEFHSICSIFLNAAAYTTGVASRRSVKRASALATRFPLSCENRDCELPRLCSWILIQ